MIKQGVDVIRLNASHNADPNFLKETVTMIRDESKKAGRYIAIFLDLQGPKIRVGKFKSDKVNLVKGSYIDIVTDDIIGDEKKFSVDYKDFLNDIKVNDSLFINDGKTRAVVESVDDKRARCKVTTGGIISNNKGVNLPFTKLSMSAFTEKDKIDAKTAIEIGCDYIALSFVATCYDLISFREFLKENGSEKQKIISKIERQQAIDNLEDIVKHSDAVMVARGDLGVEIGVEHVPKVQKQIIQTANKFIKPVIVATQMLESMIESTIATRAEVSDIANAIYDRCDAVMLSAETAVGIDPPNVIKVMSEICKETDKHLTLMRRERQTIDKKIFEFDTTATSFCRAADQIAEENDAKAIIAFTSSGNTPLIASKLDSLFPIITPTDCLEVCHRVSIYRGVQALKMPKDFVDIVSWTDMIKIAVDKAVALGYLEKGDCVIVTAGIPIGQSNGINSIRIIRV